MYHAGCKPSLGVPVHNVNNAPHLAVIHDVRSKLDAFELDINGCTAPVPRRTLSIKRGSRQCIMPRWKISLRKYAGDAKRICIFNRAIRRNAIPETQPGRLTAHGPAVSRSVPWRLSAKGDVLA